MTPPLGHTLHRSLAAILRDHAARDPQGAALIEPERRFSWRDYDRYSDAIAARLRAAGLGRGEHVGLLTPDGIILHGALTGIEKAGCVALGLGARAGLREAAHLLAKGRAVALLSLGQHRGEDARDAYRWLAEQAPGLRAHIILPDEPEALLEETAEPAPLMIGPDDVFLLNSTSGTTGMPKCVVHDQRRWFAFHDMVVEAGALTGDDIFMSCPPAPFGFGIWTSHVTPLLLGAPVIVFPRFDAETAIAMLERHRVTVMAAVTTQMNMMLNAPRFRSADLSALRAVFAGGEAIPVERARAFERDTGAKVLNAYGSNETGALSCTTVDDPQEKRIGTAGRARANMQVRLFDGSTGQDVTASGRGRPGGKGPLLSRGYFDDDAANARLFTPDGWMLMDDIVEIDGEGYVRVVGRTGDFVLRGGKNISCAAVEEAACTHPAVHLAAAVAAPDATFGERVALFVTLRPGFETLSLDDLVAHFRENRASPEIFPELLEVRDELPRSTGDKIAKHQLRQEVGALVARAAAARELRTAS